MTKKLHQAFNKGEFMVSHSNDRSYQAFRILQAAFIIGPILVGIDTCFNILSKWPSALTPLIQRITTGHSHEFMVCVGIFEILAGIGTFFKPQWFSYVIAAWLLVNIINLLSAHTFTLALLQVGLLIAALALARLSLKYDN